MPRLRTLLALVALAGCGTAAPARAPSSGGAEVMVVGTEHGGHVTTPGYPMSKLGALIDAYKPDLVLVEIRPAPFAMGHYEDGPIEMSYVTLHAKSRGIAVAPIDWWRDEDVGQPIGSVSAGPWRYEFSTARAVIAKESANVRALLSLRSDEGLDNPGDGEYLTRLRVAYALYFAASREATAAERDTVEPARCEPPASKASCVRPVVDPWQEQAHREHDGCVLKSHRAHRRAARSMAVVDQRAKQAKQRRRRANRDDRSAQKWDVREVVARH